jgi:hypothetical protein
MNLSETIDAALAWFGPKATYGGAGVAGGSWFMSSEFGVVVGVCFAGAGYATTLYYSRKRDKREQAEHDARMGLYE